MTNSDITKKAMVKALEKSLGIVSTACNTVGISRQTHYRWISEDDSYREQVENISESAIDFVESKLFQKIGGVSMLNNDGEVYSSPPSDTAIIFYLKTKAKKRGYIERQETEHSGTMTNKLTIEHIGREDEGRSTV